MTKRFFYCIFLLASLVACSAGRHETTCAELESPLIANDISNQKVSSFAEDEHGHIWMGTFRGLNRFNVHEFRQYFCTDDLNSLPDNQIQCLFRDSKNRLWVSTVNGMALYTEQDSFKRIPMESMSRNSVQIIEDKSGRIYINTQVSIAVYDEQEGKFKDLLSMADGTLPMAGQCFITPSDDLLIATSVDIKIYDSSSMKVDRKSVV